MKIVHRLVQASSRPTTYLCSGKPVQLPHPHRSEDTAPCEECVRKADAGEIPPGTENLGVGLSMTLER